jgi:NADPH:quinone reductase-like Zn-dependent oxidoreductase
MSTMRVIVHHEFGEPSDVLQVEEVPLPEPGPGEVRIRTTASPIHNHDLWTIRGTYGFKPELPARAGTEAVGVVDALGEGVDSLTVGQRVISGGVFGVWAEYFVARAGGVTPIDDALPDEAAAQLIMMPFSAISLLDSLGLGEGEWFAQNAANGAVGRLVAQLAVSRGVKVLGLVRRAAGVDELAAQGIGDIVATDEPGWRDRVAQLVGDAPIRVGIDSVGGSGTRDLVSVLADEGTVIAFGAMGAPNMEIPSGDVIFRQITVKGFWGSLVSRATSREQRAAFMAELSEGVRSGALTLPVEASYSFDDARKAADANFAAGRAGKILLTP